jgi:hypothetical protein
MKHGLGGTKREWALIPVILGVGVLASWLVQLSLVASQPADPAEPTEPPPPPVDLGSPLAGRWEGVWHAKRRDPPAILVLHPRFDSSLDGFLYVNGSDRGRFGEGTYTLDSLYFEDMWMLRYAGRYEGGEMVVERGRGRSHVMMELRRVSPDTTRLDPLKSLEDPQPAPG